MMMFAQALNETLEELGAEPGAGPGGVRRPRGSLVTRRMWNRNFSGQPRSSCAGVTHQDREAGVGAACDTGPANQTPRAAALTG